MSLQDTTASMSAVGSPDPNVTIADLMSLNPRTIINKGIYQYLALYGFYYFDLDSMWFSPADQASPAMLALKSAALNVLIDAAGAQARQSFPMLQI